MSSTGGANITVAVQLQAGSNIIAANDNVVVREIDGLCRRYTVAAVSNGNKTIQLNSNHTAGVNGDSDVWWHGVTGDTDPNTGLAHQVLPSGTANTPTTYSESNFGICVSVGTDEPILIHSNNATNAGTLSLVVPGYVA